MKKAYIVTSAIETSTSPLTYSPVRSVFSTEERLRHTVMTVASLDKVCDTDSVIYFLELSDNYSKYAEFFKYQSNLKFISVKEEFPEIYNEVTTHANKSRCETLLTYKFLETYKEELKSYDLFVKLCGRYFLDRTFEPSALTDTKIYFKKPRYFAWQDWWGYDAVKINDGKTLGQYCSVIFGWGNIHFNKMVSLYKKMSDVLADPKMQHYDIETLLYFYTRQFKEDIIETDWQVYGWLAPTGEFVKE